VVHQRGVSSTVVLVVLVVAGVLVLGACGSSGSDSSARTPVEKAQAKVDRAKTDLDEAKTTFSSSSKAFCGDAKDLIVVVDRYGQAVERNRVTVGEVKSAAGDVSSVRKAVGDSATQATEDDAAVVEAEAALADANLELAGAQAAAKGQTTTTVAASSTTTTPLVPKQTVDQVTSAEEALRSAVEGITPDTTLVAAGIHVSSAAHAVEVAWLRLFVDAGCVTDADQAKAVEAVTAYTGAVQQALTTAGYYHGPIDGVYGAETVAAVEGLQKAAQLPATGLVDPATARALDAAVTQKAGSAVAGASARTAGIQGGLKVLGYWDGPIDGKPSAALSQAVAQLQSDLGLDPTGVVDPVTLDAIAQTVTRAKAPTTPTTSVPTTTVVPTTVATTSTTTG
jgi:peptidoglycan hydrolase-like protein with peptidoglycan-binding domain